MEDYPYRNISLTGTVAKPLILELFNKQRNVARCVINERVAELHRSRGGFKDIPNSHCYRRCFGFFKTGRSAKGI